jgi:hypothetical protein
VSGPGRGVQSKFRLRNSPFTIHYLLFVLLFIIPPLLNPESRILSFYVRLKTKAPKVRKVLKPRRS